MKNYLLWLFLVLWVTVPFFVGANNPSWWVLWSPISQSDWIKNAAWNNDGEKCTTVLNRTSCDYTWPSKALRLGYEYEFADEFRAWNQSRRMKNACGRVQEPTTQWDYNEGSNPSFWRTSEIKNHGYRVDKNTSMVVLKADKIYQINAVPDSRSSNNLFVKYVIEYANDEAATTRYQHTECYPYEISWCWDGVVDKDWFKKDPSDPAEECDPAAPEWKNRSDWKTCSNTCTIVEPKDPVCSSSYNGKTEYTPSSAQWLKSTDKLCDEGSVDGFDFSPKTWGPRIFSWNCKNGSKTTAQECKAYQQWCGDGEKNGNEDCDDGEKNGTNSSTCSKSCTNVGSVECWTNNGWKKYFFSRQVSPWLSTTSAWMCPAGLTVGAPIITWTDYHLEWTCSNANGGERTCKAYQEYCWDRIINWDEECDWTDFCDFECKKITPSSECSNVFTGKLRVWEDHTFSDKFTAGWKDRYLYYWPDDVKFVENHWDYNNGNNPTFQWTSQLVNNWMKVWANTSMVVIESKLPKYHVVNHPTKRAWDNLYIEYTIWYGNEYRFPAPAKSNLYSDKECAYYEISRCGDGVLDKDYGEECDPEVQPWKDDWTCNPDTCKEEIIAWHLKIKKTLVWSKEIQKIWDEVKWKIRVTAVSGSVTNFTITDKLPPVLAYKSYVVSHTWSVNDIVFLWENKETNEVTWNAKWTLKSGDFVEIELTTSAKEMPKTDYENVACVHPDDNPKDENCDEEPLPHPALRIKKSFTDWTKEKTVKIWDEIAYKITFGNSGNAVATITSIKDFLPKNVWYVSSSIFVNGEKIHTNVESGSEIINENKRVDGVFVDIYGGITLKPGEYGHIILTWKVLTWNQDNRTNFACIYLNDEKIDCDDATHNFVEETVMCESDIKWGSNNICNGSNRTVPVTCNSTWWVANKIEIICDNTVQYSWTNISTLTWNCVFGPSAWSHTVQCKVNWSTKAVTGSSCEWNYTVTNSCGWWSSCFIAWTRVLMCNGDEKPIEQVQTWDCVQWETRPNTVKWYDRPKLGDRNLWRINKKWDYFVSDEHPFKTTQWWKSFNPEMSAEEIDKAWEEWMIKGEYPTIVGKLDIKDVLYRRKWQEIIEYLETLDPAEKKPDTQLYNLVLDGDNTYYANGYLVHNKWSSWGWSKTPSCEAIDIKDDKIKCTSTTTTAYFKLTCDKQEYIYTEEKDRDHEFKNTDVCKNAKTITCSVSKNTNWSWSSSSKCKEERKEYPTPQWCFNVNEGNFSIEEKEILPFYRNMANLDSEYYGNGDNYTEINGDYKNAESNYNNKWSCTEEQEGKIAKDSMVCTFIIADGDKNHYGKKPDWTNSENYLYKITWPCLSADNAVKKSDLIKARYDQMVKDYCKDNRTCYFYYNEERPNVSNYKKAVLPTAVYYIESFGSHAQIYANVWWDSRELQWNKWTETQKAFWEYKMQLSEVKYLRCNWGSWQQEIPKEAVCQSNFVLTNSYTVQKTPSWNLQASTDKLSKYLQYNGDPVFVKLLNAIQTTTYEPNANVEKAMKSFIDKYSKLAVKVDLKNNSFLKGSSISKVPWKSIYFVDGDITINWWWNKIKNPFTIVQTKWNAIVNGDINYNMMLLTNWNITFKWNCESDQKVKWIFYAWGNLSRGDSIDKNDSTAHKYWCTKGGLHVKWVLIWKNFNQLMNKSRSHINDWFTWQESNRKSYVMNGASVLIEYSPSIFNKSTMPPGAEDFTTALSIYKQ